MKKSLTVFSLVLLLMCLGSSARAVTWSFDFESLDESMDTWGPELPAVEIGAIEYDYQWELTSVLLRIEGAGLPGGFQWIDILGGLPAEDTSGFGTESSIPFMLDPIQIDEAALTADIRLGVLTDGTGTGLFNNITFGVAAPHTVTGVQIAGNFTVTPEPATVVLLSVGACAIFRKRRSRKL